MWRVTTSVFGFILISTHSTLLECIDEIHQQWASMGFDNMDWYRIEEFYENKWYQRGFLKIGN